MARRGCFFQKITKKLPENAENIAETLKFGEVLPIKYIGINIGFIMLGRGYAQNVGTAGGFPFTINRRRQILWK